jgi:hypothetical protein
MTTLFCVGGIVVGGLKRNNNCNEKPEPCNIIPDAELWYDNKF